MRLGAVMMVRNEADIIEASIRHNLRLLDHLLVIDHCSDDGTATIVRALIEEGLPVSLVTDNSLAFRQGLRSTEGARWLFDHENADWVFPLDADELLKSPSRDTLEWGLGHASEGMHLRVRLQTYVADEYHDAAPFSVGRFRRRLAIETHTQLRIAIRRSFLGHDTQVVTDGNHLVVDTAHPGRDPGYPALSADIVVIAHFPIRSARQVTNKTILGWLAHSLMHGPEGTAFHWRELFEEIKAHGVVEDDRLLGMAVNYGMPHAQWREASAVELVDDPLPPGPESRHSNGAAMDALPLLMTYAERLVKATPGSRPSG
jgi:glycosyltransferase involved in cell wall biosynthesis